MTRFKKQLRARGIRNGHLRFKYMSNLYSYRSIIYHVVSLLKAAKYCVANLSRDTQRNVSEPHQTPPTQLIPSPETRLCHWSLCFLLLLLLTLLSHHRGPDRATSVRMHPVPLLSSSTRPGDVSEPLCD